MNAGAIQTIAIQVLALNYRKVKVKVGSFQCIDHTHVLGSYTVCTIKMETVLTHSLYSKVLH